MVFYRKYRPQRIEELDSKDVRDKLTSFLSKKSSIHALLFTGPKGLGKTSAARIVAKIINCEKLNEKQKAKKEKLNFEPCNKCAQCISIINGSNIDVLEIDGASNRGIDEIRDLREKVKLSPAAGRKKVYIIDEVHMLTSEAFNALLKTLEEPPEHVIFILCTTEFHKVPATIASRCFQIAFKRATKDELIRSFLRIAKQEKISVDKDALLAISDLSDGSFRDGAKIFEEIHSAVGNKKITKEIVENKFQISNLSSFISELIKLLAKRDAKKSLELVSRISEQGVDMKFFLEQLIIKVHELLLIRVGVLVNKDTDAYLSIDEIKELSELLVEASSQLRFAVLPQMPLEMAIVEWCIDRKGNASQDSTEVVHENFRVRNTSKASFLNPKTEGVNATNENFADSPRQKLMSVSSSKNNIWQNLIEKIKSHNHSAAGLLRGCNLKNFDGKKLEIEAKFKFHKEKLDDIKMRGLIEKIMEDITGKKIKMSVMLSENSKH